MNNEITYKIAEKSDLEAIARLLDKNKLPFSDIFGNTVQFIIASANSGIIGCIGIEIYGNEGFLRSFAIEPSMQNKGIGKILLTKFFKYSREKGIQRVHLLTTTAKDYFLRFGFLIQNRNLTPESIQNTSEFKSLCPSSAIYMLLSDIPVSQDL